MNKHLKKDRCMSCQKMRKNIEPIFTEKCFQCTSIVYNMEVSGYFATENYTQRRDLVKRSL